MHNFSKWDAKYNSVLTVSPALERNAKGDAVPATNIFRSHWKIKICIQEMNQNKTSKYQIV